MGSPRAAESSSSSGVLFLRLPWCKALKWTPPAAPAGVAMQWRLACPAFDAHVKYVMGACLCMRNSQPLLVLPTSLRRRAPSRSPRYLRDSRWLRASPGASPPVGMTTPTSRMVKQIPVVKPLFLSVLVAGLPRSLHSLLSGLSRLGEQGAMSIKVFTHVPTWLSLRRLRRRSSHNNQRQLSRLFLRSVASRGLRPTRREEGRRVFLWLPPLAGTPG